MNDEPLPDNLARALKALDADAGRAAARVDAGRVADGVLKRLRLDPEGAVAPARRWNGGALRVAAAAVVLVIAGTVAQRLAMRSVVTTDDSAWVAIYADSIVTAAKQSDSAVTLASAITVDDLNETELRTLLRIMESSEETQ